MAKTIKSPDNRFDIPIHLLFALRPTEKADEELARSIWSDHAKVFAMVQSLHTICSPKLADCSPLYVVATASTGLKDIIV